MSGCKNELPLDRVSPGGKVLVVELLGGKEFRNRLVGMGVNVGSELEVLQFSSSGPLLIATGQTRLALGRGMAEKIMVVACRMRSCRQESEKEDE